MNKTVGAVLSSAYFPPIEYFRVIARVGNVFLEANETFQKQTYRNRCKILAADGVLSLSIPLIKGEDRAIASMKIDYSKPWLQQHKRALISAYNSSPFFEYYQDDIFEILDRKYETLFQLNCAILDKMLRLLGLKNNLTMTTEYLQEYPEGVVDLRNTIHPKKKSNEPLAAPNIKYSDYYQVFIEKYGFVDDLSILDLLFNEGPNSISYLIY